MQGTSVRMLKITHDNPNATDCENLWVHLSAGRLPAVKTAEAACAVRGTRLNLEIPRGKSRVKGDGRVVKTRAESATRFMVAHIYLGLYYAHASLYFCIAANYYRNTSTCFLPLFYIYVGKRCYLQQAVCRIMPNVKTKIIRSWSRVDQSCTADLEFDVILDPISNRIFACVCCYYCIYVLLL